MKKILYILLFVPLFATAQTIEDWEFQPQTTDNNMSVVFPPGTLNDFTGGQLQGFDVAGTPISFYNNWYISSYGDGDGGVGIVGADNNCDCDYAENGDELSFAILMNGETIVIIDVDPPVVYSANAFQLLESETLTFTVDGAVVVFGCTDATYIEFDTTTNLDDGSCSTIVVEGCTDETAFNYDPIANVDNDSCEYLINCEIYCCNPYPYNDYCELQCMLINIGCLDYYGCTDELACNFNVEATDNDGSCEYTSCSGCTDESASNYDASVIIDDGSCEYSILGCTICGYEEYNPNAEVDDGSCSTEIILFSGCCCINQWEIIGCGILDCSLVYCSVQYYCNENGWEISYCPDNNYLEYYFNPENWYDLMYYDNPTICNTSVTNNGITADMFIYPINTGANMTLPMPGGLLEQFSGGQIAAFMGDICVGLESITTGFIAMGLWGDDSSTELIDGLLVGEVPTFAVLYNGGVISLDQNEMTGYQTNGIATISNFQFTEPIGCTNPAACNYLSYAVIDDSSCVLPIEFYNCDNSCINDTDNDGICDELEIPGCTIWGYNNYNELATDNDGSCTVSWQEDYTNLSLSSNAIIDSIDNDYANYITSSTATIDSLQFAYDQLDGLSISIDLLLGWNIIGYTNSYEQDAEEALLAIEDLILVFKNNNADVYMPEYGFNGIGNLIPGEGYQLKVSEAYNAFSFENSPTFGCTDETAFNYNSQVNTDDGTCILEVQIGDLVEGGIVFYLDETGEHGLVAALEDITEGGVYSPFGWDFYGFEWGCYQTSGAFQYDIGTGYQNTIEIAQNCQTTIDGGITAAQASLNYTSEGYTDWFLPSFDELEEMYNTIGNGSLQGNVGGFEMNDYPLYWSSTELGHWSAWIVSFNDGSSSITTSAKYFFLRVRAVRAF